MLTYREFSAWIVSEDKLLDEYKVTVDTDTDKVSCWIPSESGKSIGETQVHNFIRAHSSLSIASPFPSDFSAGTVGPLAKGQISGAPSPGAHLCLQDKPIHHVSAASGERANGDGGIIGLKIKRIVMEGWRPADNLQRLPDSVGLQKNVSGHRVGLGRVMSTYEQRPRTLRAKPYDGSDSYITFVFRYKPKELLLSQGIMPADDALRATPLTMPNLRTSDNSGPTVPIQSVTCVQTINTKRRNYYLGEGILDYESRQDKGTLT
ncbi:hypothetical protein JVU11DRAFT_6966 [Chiua virens]|nr:hypothetical protein JVU11DRAFT_6966 [Chiua virens]